MTPATKLKQAIDKTIKTNNAIVTSVLRVNAENYDDAAVVRIVRATETDWHGPDHPTDFTVSQGGQTEQQTLRNAIDRAGRRR